MTESRGAVLAYPRLCIAYFCQFGIWAAWAGALSQYAGGILNFEGWQIGSLYNAIPLGAVIAPLFIGPIADRYFSAQKVMSVLHLIGGGALLTCGVLCMTGNENFMLLMTLMLLAGACYMPTLGLMNSVVFKHLPSPSMAPYVFVFGTIGWIIITLYIAGWCGGAETPYFFLVGGGVSVFLAFYCLTLPNTPPKDTSASGEKTGGLAVLSLFKDFPFVIFVLCAFLVSIPAINYFFPAQVPFLTERGYPSPLALTTLNQFSELIFMLALPFLIPRIGLKNVLLIGMAAWSLRYFCFSMPYFETALVGLMLHGFCYTFLYVAAFMYAEKVAPAHLKASAQSMMVFLLLGVGQILGGFAYGDMRDRNTPKYAVTTVSATQLAPSVGMSLNNFETVVVPVPKWSEAEDSWFQHLDLAAHVRRWRNIEPKKDEKRTVDFGRLIGSKELTPETISGIALGDLIQDATISRMSVATGMSVADEQVADAKIEVDLVKPITASVQYTHDDLKRLAREIAGGSDDFKLDRKDWLAAQAHDWQTIFRLPAIFIAVCFVIFLLLGRNPRDPEEGGAKT